MADHVTDHVADHVTDHVLEFRTEWVLSTSVYSALKYRGGVVAKSFIEYIVLHRLPYMEGGRVTERG